MNIVGILKQLRVSKMLFHSSMKPEERMVLKIQRAAVISSDSSDAVPTDYDEILNQVIWKENNQREIQNVFALGRVNRELLKFANTKEPITKKA